MANQQVPLNGAYYGPAVPPPQPPPRNNQRRRGCCCSCLCLFCKIILCLVLIIGMTALLFWVIVRPTEIKFHVNNVTLNKFNLTSDNILHYNMTVNVTVRNSNKKIGVYYDMIEVRGYYEGERFDTKYLTPFYQGHKNTSYLKTEFVGQQLVVLNNNNNNEKSEYEKDKSEGVYGIDVMIYFKMRFKIGEVKSYKCKPRVKCGLKVPLAVDGKTIAGGNVNVNTNPKCEWN
ncbi:hypothetical protein ACFE04_025624 [Oxalis oulophora]